MAWRYKSRSLSVILVPTGIFLVTTVLCLSGCGKSKSTTIPVEGTVTLDSQPIQGAQVLFTPTSGGRPASGETDEQGHFSLMTFAPGDGALPGSHQVSVLKVEASGMAPQGGANATAPPAGGGQELRYLLPMKYANGKTSGLSVDVNSGMEPVKLELQSR